MIFSDGTLVNSTRLITENFVYVCRSLQIETPPYTNVTIEFDVLIVSPPANLPVEKVVEPYT